jgi:hypothetical protein
MLRPGRLDAEAGEGRTRWSLTLPLASRRTMGQTGSVVEKPSKKHDPAKPVSTREELEELLLAGLASGEPRPVTDEDWERLRQRALAGTELRKSG